MWTSFDGQANWDKRHSVFIRLGYRLVITWQISSASCTSITLKDKEKHPLNQKQAFLTTAVTAAAEQQVPGDCVHRAYTSLALTTRRRRKYAQVWRSRLPSLKITGLFWRQPVTQCGASSPLWFALQALQVHMYAYLHDMVLLTQSQPSVNLD